MKKLFLTVMVLAAGATATKAQFYIGGGLGFWHKKEHSTTFNISPDAGYSFNDRWAVGLTVGFDALMYSKKGNWGYIDENGEFYYRTPKNIFGFYAAPYARFSYFSKDRVKLFLDGVVGISTEMKKDYDPDFGFQVIVRPGIAINLTDHFSLVGTFGALGWRHNYRNTNSGFGFDFHNSLGFGFYYSF